MYYDALPKLVSTPRAVTHGRDIVPQGEFGCNVGPTALLGSNDYPMNLGRVAVPGRGYWRGDEPQEFSLDGTYVYNNNLGNKGGITSGTTTIDGYSIPSGTRVVQFMDFSASGFYFSNSSSFLFRGCRLRSAQLAPGYFNCSVDQTGAMHIFYCDLGGNGANDLDYNEVPIKVANGSSAICYRNFITYTTTGIQINIPDGGEVTENYISKLTYYYGPDPPPGEGTDKHMNGCTFNGTEDCMLVLRNFITGPHPDEAGRDVIQTDCISFFQDFGEFTGTGTNRDSSTGYFIVDNFIGGTGFCIYAGKNAGSSGTSVQNMHVTGNVITERWWSGGGSFGPITAQPTWDTLGNVKSGNTFHESGAAW